MSSSMINNRISDNYNVDGRITRQAANETLLNDEKLSDLKLRGTDGKLVLAHRAILAARSAVFRGLLFGQFRESVRPVVDLCYPGSVLQAVVEFVYKDDCTIFHQQQQEQQETNESYIHWKAVSVNKINTVVELADASNYFALPELMDKVQACAKNMMIRDNRLVCLFLVACHAHVPTAIEKVKIVCISIIRSNPALLLKDESSLEMLSSDLLEYILKDNDMDADEYTLFLILQAWYEGRDEVLANSTTTGSVLDKTERIQGNRKRKASQLSECIKFDHVSPVVLSTTVASSGIVSNEQLSNAYRLQALRAHQRGIVYKKSRRLPVWNSSGDVQIVAQQTNFYALKCTPMNSGVHQWSIRVDAECNDTWPGVFAVGKSKNVWVCRHDGRTHNTGRNRGGMEKGTVHGLGFQTGSVLHFTLDLTGSGKLSCTVDGRRSFDLFDEMVVNSGRKSFVPTVFMKKSAAVTLLEFS